ncbi:MAG: hypothetical protein IH616_16070 [Gemmatimonadales bacterium]|nr:hypothetical protein [Gemmatimonadales bacterium]
MHDSLRTAIALAASILMGTACAESPAAPLLSGEWGGDHIGLVVSATGANLEYDCAYGTIDSPIDLHRSGSFVASGTHTFEHGGPIREGELPDIHPAEYRGWVIGSTMTLTVTLTDTTRTVGTFTLRRGGNPLVFKCV